MVLIGCIRIWSEKHKQLRLAFYFNFMSTWIWRVQLIQFFWCLFLFAFFLFARKSNLVPDTPNYKDKTFLLRQNVKQIDKILIVSINWSKTIQFGQRILEIPLVRIPGSVLCPVRAYQNMCKKVKASRVDPLFSLPKGKCIIYAEYQKKIRELVREIGLDPESFGSHSF